VLNLRLDDPVQSGDVRQSYFLYKRLLDRSRGAPASGI
jgi:hypothetical protein